MPAAVSGKRFKAPETLQPSDTDAVVVIDALKKAGRPVTNDELADLLQVSKSEASKRVTGLNGAVRRVRVGRHVAISLPQAVH